MLELIKNMDAESIRAVIVGANGIGKMIVSKDGLQAIALFTGITGYTLRDFMGLIGFGKLRDNFKKKFPDGETSEKQEEILRDSFIELEDYIKNNWNFDEKIFEKISAMLIYGIEKEELLTRQYIKILKQLSWIDLEVLMKLKDKKIPKYERSGPDLYLSNDSDRNIDDAIEQIRDELNYPWGIIEASVDILSKLRIVEKSGFSDEIGEEGEGYNKTTIWEYTYVTELGKDLIELLSE